MKIKLFLSIGVLIFFTANLSFANCPVLEKPIPLSGVDLLNVEGTFDINGAVFDKKLPGESGNLLKLRLFNTHNIPLNKTHKLISFSIWDQDGNRNWGMANAYDSERWISLSGDNRIESGKYRTIYIRRENSSKGNNSWFFELNLEVKGDSIVSLEVTLPLNKPTGITDILKDETLLYGKFCLISGAK